jgi:tetratricopeptide (TPR) repeat protein
MSDTLAIRAKEEGSTAWSSGDYPKALTKFSEAIDYSNPTTDKEFLKILYSNRSAVYLKLNQSENALNDAKKCIELDSQWLKGHTRKGDALYAKKQYTDAYNAYNAGLRITPSDPTLTEKAEKAMRAIRNEATHTSSASSSSSWSSSGTTASSAPMTGIFRQLRLVIVVCVIVYMIPFLPFRLGGTAYRVAAGLYAGLAVYDLYKKYGMPKFSTDYAQLVIPDPNTMKAFLGMMLIMSVRPYIFAIAPVFLNEVSNFTPEIFQVSLHPNHPTRNKP